MDGRKLRVTSFLLFPEKMGTLASVSQILGINRDDDDLETALAEALETEGHTAAEVESVFKHFQREGSICP